MSIVEMRPIGWVRGGRTAPEDDGWGSVRSRIELDGSLLDVEATEGLEAFSHVEVIFHFHRVNEADVCTGARHPRGRPDWPSVGILAQRARDRPNRIGSTICRLREVGSLWIELDGLDAVDGTPVLDIKPYMIGFSPRDEVYEPAWAVELMRHYW